MTAEWKCFADERPEYEISRPFWGWSESQGVYWVYWNACYSSDTVPYPECMSFTHWYPCDMTQAPKEAYCWEREPFGAKPAPPFVAPENAS